MTTRRDLRWAHAARVALAATAVVGVVALLVVLAVNGLLLQKLDRDADGRLAATLAATRATGVAPLATGGRGGDGRRGRRLQLREHEPGGHLSSIERSGAVRSADINGPLLLQLKSKYST